MNKDKFIEYRDHLTEMAARKMADKEKEYLSMADVMASFRVTATFRNQPVPVTIMNHLAKPLQSISAMVDDEFSAEDQYFDSAVWDEKFIDSINYLQKLYACIKEERSKVEVAAAPDDELSVDDFEVPDSSLAVESQPKNTYDKLKKG
jgi:hypothetical protein